MSRTRRTDWSSDELARLEERVLALLERAALGSEGFVGMGVSGPTWEPPADVVERHDAFEIAIDLPGVERDDLEVSVDGRIVEIHGERRLASEGAEIRRLEGRYGPFRRRFQLPQELSEDEVGASLRGGVLRVTLPKRRTRRQVEIGDAS